MELNNKINDLQSLFLFLAFYAILIVATIIILTKLLK